MKKIITVIIAIIIMLPSVKAETYQIPIENRKANEPTQSQVNYIYNTLMINYPKEQYDYYIVNRPTRTDLYVMFVEKGKTITQTYTFNSENDTFDIRLEVETDEYYECVVRPNEEENTTCNEYNNLDINVLTARYPNEETKVFNYTLYDTSFILNSKADFEMEDFYADNIIVENNQNLPKLKNLYQYNSYADYESNYVTNYNEINLDNYDYVILTLKDYNRNDAFSTNLQVKGQVGITPVYNYGQTSKDAVTGVKVQDRCNAYFENYTGYPLYILKQDLQNNVVYIVKKCQNNSSFKYDKTVFNVTYVTQENRADPIVTINGKQYHTIPYENLPSTATENEEENYIPGQSGAMNDTGGLDGAIKGVQQKMGEIWDTFTYFTQFINQIFSVLPQELRIVLVSGFTIMIVLGLIKIFIN